MLIAFIVTTALIFAVSVFLLFVYRQDRHNLKNTIVALVITMVGTFSGVLLAFSATDYQTKVREQRELGAIIDQADAEANNASYQLATMLAGFTHSITKAPATEPTVDEIQKYKNWLTKEPYVHKRLIESIDSMSTSLIFDRLPYTEMLYLNPFCPRYISPLCQPLGQFIHYGETLRTTIKARSTSPAEKLQAVIDYRKYLNELCEVLELSNKYIRNTLSATEATKVKELAGLHNILAEPWYGNEYKGK